MASPKPRSLPRVLFFDLDGTLLAPGSILTRRTATTVRAALDCGAEVVLATGGFSARALLLARLLRGKRESGVWTITHNGAAIWDAVDRLVYHETLPAEAMRAALDAAGRRVWITFEAADATGRTSVHYAGRMRREMVDLLWGPQPRDPGPHQVEKGISLAAAEEAIPKGVIPDWSWRGVRAGSALAAKNVLGAWCVGTPAALAPLDAAVSQGKLANVRYEVWTWRLAQELGRPRLGIVGRDIGPHGVNKGTAAAWLCRRLDVPPKEVAAFGDAGNDFELLTFAGTAVAMANASPHIRQIADILAPPAEEEGVASMLESWLAVGPSARRRV